MKKPSAGSRITRRRWLRQGVRHAAVLGLAGSAVIQNRRQARAADNTAPNPFAYDVSRLEKTDPKLVRFTETRRFHCAQPDPRRLTLGPDGNLFVAARDAVAVLDPTGAPVRELPVAGPARCVAIAADGTTFVGLRDHVELFDAGGQRTAAWDSPGRKTWLTGLAVGDQGELFAADSGNRLVWRYNRAGKVLGRLGEKNPQRDIAGFILPSPYLDVAWHKDGLVRVNNPGRHRVEVYTREGDLELTWGKASMGIDGFCGCCNPIAVALLPDGRYVTCEKGLPRVKIYREHGEFDCVVAGPELFPQNARIGAGEEAADGARAALDAAVDAHGRVFVLDTITGDIRRMEPKA
jgi:hypothetical protein